MIKILFSDKDLIVCVKEQGMLSQPDLSKATDMVTELSAQEGGEIFPVQRLDRNVGGVMVYARNKKAAAKLSEAVQDKTSFIKEYIAVIHGKPDEESEELKDFLYKDASRGKAYIVKKMRSGVKEASLFYTLMGTEKTEMGEYSLLKIRLGTGRFHQIRAQFASRKMPIAGDGKYGSRDNKCELALFSERMCFSHPSSGEKMDFCELPKQAYPWNLFGKYLNFSKNVIK